jgi:hypothetical protein
MGADWQAMADAAQDATQPSKAPRRGALPGPPPPAGAAPAELLNFLSLSLRLPAPVVRVERWGASSVSPVTMTLADGRRLRFGAASDLFVPAAIVQNVVLQLGTDTPQLPPFTKADALVIATVAIRACEALEEEDERDVTVDWQNSFLRICERVHHGSYDDPEARWAAMRWLDGFPAFDARTARMAHEDATYRPPALVWQDGTTWVRVSDVERFVRGALSQQLSPAQVVARMREAEWGHRPNAETRKPGVGRVNGHRGRDVRVRRGLHHPRWVRDTAGHGRVPACPRDNARTHARARVQSAGTPRDTDANPDRH